MVRRGHVKCVAFLLPLLVACSFVTSAAAQSGDENAALAATPPMGWNSWDGYGTAVTALDFGAVVAAAERATGPAQLQYSRRRSRSRA